MKRGFALLFLLVFCFSLSSVSGQTSSCFNSGEQGFVPHSNFATRVDANFIYEGVSTEGWEFKVNPGGKTDVMVLDTVRLDSQRQETSIANCQYYTFDYQRPATELSYNLPFSREEIIGSEKRCTYTIEPLSPRISSDLLSLGGRTISSLSDICPDLQQGRSLETGVEVCPQTAECLIDISTGGNEKFGYTLSTDSCGNYIVEEDKDGLPISAGEVETRVDEFKNRCLARLKSSQSARETNNCNVIPHTAFIEVQPFGEPAKISIDIKGNNENPEIPTLTNPRKNVEAQFGTQSNSFYEIVSTPLDGTSPVLEVDNGACKAYRVGYNVGIHFISPTPRVVFNYIGGSCDYRMSPTDADFLFRAEPDYENYWIAVNSTKAYLGWTYNSETRSFHGPPQPPGGCANDVFVRLTNIPFITYATYKFVLINKDGDVNLVRFGPGQQFETMNDALASCAEETRDNSCTYQNDPPPPTDGGDGGSSETTGNNGIIDLIGAIFQTIFDIINAIFQAIGDFFSSLFDSNPPKDSSSCGDGIINQATEQCDDGNTISGDGCSADCKIEKCGDGIINEGEECDDGNTISGDGCSNECKNENLKRLPMNLMLDTLACKVYKEVPQSGEEGKSFTKAELEGYIIANSQSSSFYTYGIEGLQPAAGSRMGNEFIGKILSELQFTNNFYYQTHQAENGDIWNALTNAIEEHPGSIKIIAGYSDGGKKMYTTLPQQLSSYTPGLNLDSDVKGIPVYYIYVDATGVDGFSNTEGKNIIWVANTYSDQDRIDLLGLTGNPINHSLVTNYEIPVGHLDYPKRKLHWLTISASYKQYLENAYPQETDAQRQMRAEDMFFNTVKDIYEEIRSGRPLIRYIDYECGKNGKVFL